MCPTVHPLAILCLGLVSSYLTQSLFQHRAVGIGHWPLGIGTVTGHQGHHEPSGAMSASDAGQLRPDMSGPPMANFIVGRKNCEIGRLGFQLPIAPSSSRARETRPQLENGIARSRALKVPALGLDHKDFQAVGYAGRLEESMRSDGVELRER